jgi:hypothetical protein
LAPFPFPWRHFLDLIVTMDDATGAIYSAFLTEEEGAASTFRALKQMFLAHSLPMSLYTDRGCALLSHAQSRRRDRPRSSHPGGAALEQLGVEHIGPIRRRRGDDRSARSRRFGIAPTRY